jgi:hypothetical protein
MAWYARDIISLGLARQLRTCQVSLPTFLSGRMYCMNIACDQNELIERPCTLMLCQSIRTNEHKLYQYYSPYAHSLLLRPYSLYNNNPNR